MLFLEVDYMLAYIFKGKKLKMTAKLCYRLVSLVKIIWMPWVSHWNPAQCKLIQLSIRAILVFLYLVIVHLNH